MPQNFIYEKYHEKKKKHTEQAKTKDATDTAQQEQKEEEEEQEEVWVAEKKNEMYVYDEALSHVHRLERGERSSRSRSRSHVSVALKCCLT